MQNAEMEVKTEIKMPSAPYRGTKAGSSNSAPTVSTANVIPTIPLSSLGVSSKLVALVDSWASCKVRNPNFRRISRLKNSVSVTRLSPPTWIRARITPWPKKVQWV